jgi:cytochrome P450
MSVTEWRTSSVFDFCSQEFKQNPFPSLARMREQGPVIRTKFPLFGNVWMATTYDAVNDLLRDHHWFVQSPTAAGNRWMGTILRWLPRTLQPIATNMLLRDEPDHRRLRKLVDGAFQVRSVEALQPRLEVLAEEALDRLAEQATVSPGGVDLLTHFARPFPLAVICELLGLPSEDRPNFTRWASSFSRSSSFMGIAFGLWGLGKLMRYLKEEIKRQSTRPRDGLLAALIQAEEAGDKLTEDELLAMAFLLLAAGHETTLHQIACSVLTLLDHPEQLRELSADWSFRESAVNELFRYVSFAQVAKPRYAQEDIEFWGQPIRRGQMLFACLASANCDPTHFSNPDCLDLHRQSPRHFAFGAGIHFCLGAALARIETEIALQHIFTRFPDVRLAVPRSQIRYSRRPGTRGLVALPIKW